jgi:hypothetical protein
MKASLFYPQNTHNTCHSLTTMELFQQLAPQQDGHLLPGVPIFNASKYAII